MDSTTYRLDGHERRILTELQRDGRLSHAELARRIGLSPTAVADRVRDLENAGVIRCYTAVVDAGRVGLPILALVTMHCDGTHCRRLAADIAGFPEVVECHRLTGDASALLKVAVATIADLERVVDRLSDYGKPSTALVLSSPLSGRPWPLEPPAAGVATSVRPGQQPSAAAGARHTRPAGS